MSGYNESTFQGLNDFELMALLSKALNSDRDVDFIEAIQLELIRRKGSYPLKTFIDLDWKFCRGGNLGPLDKKALEFLHYRGVGIIINLMAENNDEEYLVKESEFGFLYYYFPIKDFDAPETIEIMDQIIEIIIKGPFQTFIHCNGGRGRSGMVETCYLIKNTRIPFLDAMDFTLRRSKMMDGKEFEYSESQINFMKSYWQKEYQKAERNAHCN